MLGYELKIAGSIHVTGVTVPRYEARHGLYPACHGYGETPQLAIARLDELIKDKNLERAAEAFATLPDAEALEFLTLLGKVRQDAAA